MKKIGQIFKEVSQTRIKETFKESEAMFVIKYSGISSPDLSALRQNLRDTRATLFVVKNSVARRALKDIGLEGLIKNVEGPCGLVFIKEEPVGASKALYSFYKEHEALKLEGGYLKDKLLETKDIEAMSKLPSKEVLRAQLVMTLNSPIVKLVYVLKGNLRKFVYCLEQVKQKRTTQK